MSKKAKKKETVMTENVNETVNQAEPNISNETETQAPIQLTLQDLQNAVSIIELASRRGAFQAQELTNIGATYNRLVAFLRAAQAQTAANPVESETAQPVEREVQDADAE